MLFFFKTINISMETIHQKNWTSVKHSFCTSRICYRKADANSENVRLNMLIISKKYTNLFRSICRTFAPDQYISLQYVNANLRDVSWNTDHGNFWIFFPRQWKDHKASPPVIKNWKVLVKMFFFFFVRRNRAKNCAQKRYHLIPLITKNYAKKYPSKKCINHVAHRS